MPVVDFYVFDSPYPQRAKRSKHLLILDTLSFYLINYKETLCNQSNTLIACTSYMGREWPQAPTDLRKLARSRYSSDPVQPGWRTFVWLASFLPCHTTPSCHTSNQQILCVTYQVNTSYVSRHIKSTNPMSQVTWSQQILCVTLHQVNKSYVSRHMKSTNPTSHLTSSQQILCVTSHQVNKSYVSRHVTSSQQILCVTSLNINKSYVSHVKWTNPTRYASTADTGHKSSQQSSGHQVEKLLRVTYYQVRKS